jgi:FkbM family methyltransferase
MRVPRALGWFEVALLLAFAIVATRAVVSRHHRQGPSLVEDSLLQRLEARFGRERHSMGHEEWFIRDFFNDGRNGTFVDVGAWQPITGSNTYRLERALGWTGIAIDALEEWRSAYRRTRPGSRFVVAFVSDEDAGEAELHVPSGLSEVASGSEQFVRVFSGQSEKRMVSRRTLDSILEEAGVEVFDFLNMDIELGEPAALRGFTIGRYRPRLVCIEAHGSTRQAILEYFARHGYVLVGKYLPFDRVNLYFSPLEGDRDPAAGVLGSGGD